VRKGSILTAASYDSGHALASLEKCVQIRRYKLLQFLVLAIQPFSTLNKKSQYQTEVRPIWLSRSS
jgi:hypothetical protein